MEVRGESAAGQASFMLSCVVEEYARIGTPRGEILGLFRDPFFGATHGLASVLGPAEVERRVGEILDRFGVHGARTSGAGLPEEV